MPRQNKRFKKKEFLNTIEFFDLLMYYWTQGLTLNVVCLPSETQLEKTSISFLSGNQLVKASRLEMEDCAQLFS